LPLHAQKVVVGRVLGLELLVPELAAIEHQGFRDAVHRLIERVSWFTADALDDPDSDEDLQAFLGRLVDAVSVEATAMSDGARAAVRPLLSKFAEAISAFCGSPYDPLDRLVSGVSLTSREFYREFGVAVPPALWQTVAPVFVFIGGTTALSFAPEIHLQASTAFDEAKPLASRVIFQLAVRELDELTIAALPRVMLHEYIAHVPQGPYTQIRSHPDGGDTFAEGWMDYVAHQIFRRVQERGPMAALDDCLNPAWAQSYEEAAESFFVARCKVRREDVASAGRRLGVEAARLMHGVLRRLPETSENPDDYLYRMSFGLNASNLGDTRRQQFVVQIRRYLPVASHGVDVVRLIRDWAVGRIPLEDLYASILALDPS
jgi:hypothetical protein